MSKKKRDEKKEKNRQKDQLTKQTAVDNGRLIKENHNNSYYSPEFIRYYSHEFYLKLSKAENNKDLINLLRLYKNDIINLLIYWSPLIEKNMEYKYLLSILNCYWDDSNNLINIRNDK